MSKIDKNAFIGFAVALITQTQSISEAFSCLIVKFLLVVNNSHFVKYQGVTVIADLLCFTETKKSSFEIIGSKVFHSNKQ